MYCMYKRHCFTNYLEDHPRSCKWLITMVSFRPLRIRLWDPFQLAILWLINGNYYTTTYYLGRPFGRRKPLRLEMRFFESRGSGSQARTCQQDCCLSLSGPVLYKLPSPWKWANAMPQHFFLRRVKNLPLQGGRPKTNGGARDWDWNMGPVSAHIAWVVPLPSRAMYQQMYRLDVVWVLGGSSQDLDTWLITMVSFRPLRIKLWDPFLTWPFYGL